MIDKISGSARRRALTLAAAALIVAFDQLTKYLATALLAPVGSAPFIPYVMELRYVLNNGVAFSMLAGKRWMLVALTGAALCALCVYLMCRRPRTRMDWLEYVSWVMVLGGGAGNLIDRVRTGYVVDFFATTFVDFAVFNVADCFITVGIALLILSLLCSFRQQETAEQKPETAGETAEADHGGED